MAIHYPALEKDKEFKKRVADADRARAKTGHEKYLKDLAEAEARGDDIETLRQTALSLLQQVTQMKVASTWMASRASESENAKLEILAKLIKERSERPQEQTEQ